VFRARGQYVRGRGEREGMVRSAVGAVAGTLAAQTYIRPLLHMEQKKMRSPVIARSPTVRRQAFQQKVMLHVL